MLENIKNLVEIACKEYGFTPKIYIQEGYSEAEDRVIVIGDIILRQSYEGSFDLEIGTEYGVDYVAEHITNRYILLEHILTILSKQRIEYVLENLSSTLFNY
jgi:hypothetical protein